MVATKGSLDEKSILEPVLPNSKIERKLGFLLLHSIFLFGPKTSFGQSEQNPAYWLQLLLSAKKIGAKCTWNDPVTDTTMTRVLYPSDWRIWLHFLMSFAINSVGFHILVHALPIQVASQSSLTGVVFRAVGMMYLLDLDDVPGYKLTLVEEAPPEQAEKPPSEPDTTTSSPSKTHKAVPVAVSSVPVILSDQQLSQQAELILAEARAKLDALARKISHSATIMNFPNCKLGPYQCHHSKENSLISRKPHWVDSKRLILGEVMTIQ